MAHLFISYSRKDLDYANQLCEVLRQHQLDVWIDREIPSGARWQEVLLDKIETCSAMVVVVSPRSARSFWVMRELSYAHEFKKPIFPILMEGAAWPPLDEFQCSNTAEELLRGLRQLARLFISHTTADEGFASRLATDLTRLGADVWQEDDNKPEEDGVSSSQIMLLIVSASSMESAKVRVEWQAFHARNKPIIPLLIQHTAVPVTIREKQPYIDFLDQDYQLAFAQLYGLLRSLGVMLRDHEQVSVPPQPQLRLNRYEMLREARTEVWISGITLEGIARHLDVLENLVAHTPELDIRLLTIDLSVDLLNETGAWFGIHEEKFAGLLGTVSDAFVHWVDKHRGLTREGFWVGGRLYWSLQALIQLQQRLPNNLHIRAVPYRLGTGFLITDPYQPEGLLTGYPYSYRLDVAKGKQPTEYDLSPIFLSKQSSKESERWWFDKYVEEFNDLWEDATPFDWGNT